VVAQFFDTHAHLDDEQFQADLPAVIERARGGGVVGIVTIATTASSSRAALELARCYSDLAASVGIQPNCAVAAGPSDWDTVVKLAQESAKAIGETGLDRHWDSTPFAQQEDFFARHLALARQRALPVIIHCREAEADVVRMLREDFDRHGPVRGVMHSFTGDDKTAAACLEMGLYISFAGMVTYKNASALRRVAQGVPADRLLVETDSPYLSPVPLRGKRNEPANVRYTLECITQERGVAAEELAAQTTANARRLFGL
jgi:TatD DNase family protein